MLQHFESVRHDWENITQFRSRTKNISVCGAEMSIAALVAVARYHAPCILNDDSTTRDRIKLSAELVILQSAPGTTGSIYGVNTGVGASGTVTRTTDLTGLQAAILKHLTSGILPLLDTPHPDNFDPSYHESTLLLPESWVKGAMLLRLNTLLRGHSGCRWILIEKLHSLLLNNIIPSPPLRQSISASGDLAPLGYVAAALTEEVVVPVWSGKGSDRKRVPSIHALRAHGIEPIKYGPKEALAVVNGTGPSCAVGVLALHDANILMLASQALTALAVEALSGTPESFDPFISDIARPHPGQIEVSRNCRALLRGSKFTMLHDESDPTQTLRQDRYSLRTAPQWIGPQIEELVASKRTLEIEMNSSTDNPIVDLQGKRTLSGGNFQGTSVAVVMEKTRIGLQHLGKLAYAQLVELGNPALNKGLPPDLAAWEPSLDFGIKAMDVANAAYLSELCYVSNTVTNYVHSAEMHNQSVNSLALVSARYTFTAIQLLYLIYSNHLWALCQALDLRAMTRIFFDRMEAEIGSSLSPLLGHGMSVPTHAKLVNHIYAQARVAFNDTSRIDSTSRFTTVVRPLVADVLEFLSKDSSLASMSVPFEAVKWHNDLARTLGEAYRNIRVTYYESGSAAGMMGNTVHIYRFVRDTLGIPMCKGIDLDNEGLDPQVSRIYRAFETGTIVAPILAAMEFDL